MATVFRGLLNSSWQPQMNSIRLRTRINIQKPKPPHFTRAKVEELCKPNYPRLIDPAKPLYELCSGPGYQKFETVNHYELLLAKESLNLFRKHKYIFFFHENSMRTVENLEMQLLLKKCGIVVHKYGRNTLRHALVGTMYEPILAIFHSHTLLGFGNNVNLSLMLKVLKKTKIILMAGIIDDRLISVSELERYSSLPDMQTLRASLVSLLNSAAGNIVQCINHHPQMLAHHLKEYRRLSKENA